MKKFSSNFIFSGNSAPIANGVLVTDDHGRVLDLLENDDGLEDVLHIDGFLCPGFVNSHCHLELSHLKGALPEKRGLVNFISPIIELRKAEGEVIDQSMREAEREMRDNGIVAVGDICNTSDSFVVKSGSAMNFHNYIEVLALDPQKAASVFSAGLDLFEESVGMGMQCSMVPHAAYTASLDLLRLLGDHGRRQGGPLCIHNQESVHENTLYNVGAGPIKEFYSDLGNELDFFETTGTNSMEAVVQALGGEVPLLLVHNTYTEAVDIVNSVRYNSAISFCLCPNANMYIEQKLPDINLLSTGGHLIVLGTDSLASNRSLSILDEMKTIALSDSGITLSTLITWATYNGAKFLGFDDKLGTFDKGKQPGINLIYDVDLENLNITSDSKVRVIL
ncbi:MAG: amidohydrolase family protein [Flavobacteriales bacterium]|nr:amidohydrolase family protein [Flavobacteriales bacterium]